MTADEGQGSPPKGDAEARYWQLLELSPEAIAIHRDGRLVYVNPAGIQLIGAASLDQLVGRSILEFVHAEDRPQVIARARQVQVEGRLAELVTERFLRLDGEVIDVQVISIPTIHEGRAAAQVVIRDVTAQKRAEGALRRAEERMRLLVQASEELFSPLDLDQVLAEVLDLAQRHIAADAYAVWQRSPATGKWGTVASAGLSDAYREGAGQTSAHATLMPDQPLAIEDVDHEPLLAPHLAQHRAEGTRALLVTPLRFRGEVSGTIAFYYHQTHHFSEDEIREATALANLAAAAIGITSLYEVQSKWWRNLREPPGGGVRTGVGRASGGRRRARHPGR